MSKDQRYCVAWFESGPRVRGNTRAALWRKSKWPDQGKITVSFLEGAIKLRDSVQAAAELWTKHANLTLEFRDDTTKTDVRIAFQQGAGSWSLIGTTCRNAPKTKPTMNFGWLKPTSGKAEIEEVVLHEFGHALGLIHEHQSPSGGIKWKKDLVYAELKATHGWSKAKVDTNIIKPASKSESNFTKFDPLSIMLYPIPSRWTEDGFSSSTNSKLSKVDKSFIAKEYP